MQYTTYGKTGLRVSRIGFGGMRFDMSESEAALVDLVRYAYHRGINYFDTAPGYCDDRSEFIIGKALAGLPRADRVISTKLMPGHIKTAREAYDRILRSRDRLQVDCIDIFHAWNFRTMAQYRDCIRPDGLYEAMLQAKADGVIAHLAFSTHLIGDKVGEVLSDGRFEGVLMGLNILNFPYRWNGVLAARARGMAVVAMNSLAGGVIPRHEKRFAFLSRGDETPTEAALRFMVGLSEVDVALNGFSQTAHIDMACRAADAATPIDRAELTRLAGLVGDNLPELCTGCGYCRAGCPARIDIPTMLQFYNEKLLEEKSDAEMPEILQSNRIWGILPQAAIGASACVRCGRCEQACTQHLPIIDRLAEIAAWEKRLDG